MTWVVDTCLIIDVLEGDPEFGKGSALLLDQLASEGLALCPVSYVELAPAFLGDCRRQNDFLAAINVDHSVSWDWQSTQLAHRAWARQVELRRSRKGMRRPIADILIGAFASGRRGLLTRNQADFRPVFPTLKMITP